MLEDVQVKNIAMLAGLFCSGLAFAAQPKAELVDVQKIWDKGNHNAFTDLIRHKDRWLCVFREGKAHVSPDGLIRVLASKDGKSWESLAAIRSETDDLRDPKIVLAPDGRLMILGAGAVHKPRGFTHQSYVWFSEDGSDWTPAKAVGDPNYWLWRVVWHGKTGYGIAYECGPVEDNRLYRTTDGVKYDRLVAPLFTRGAANESALVFLPDDTCLCLFRRDYQPSSGVIGRARPPYKDWTWLDLKKRIGGPQMIRLPSGQLIAAVRLHDKKQHTSICTVDADAGRLDELLVLPSGGDTSYAGLVWHDGLLWVSYYSSHEGKTSIYLARVKITGE